MAGGREGGGTWRDRSVRAETGEAEIRHEDCTFISVIVK